MAPDAGIEGVEVAPAGVSPVGVDGEDSAAGVDPAPGGGAPMARRFSSELREFAQSKAML